MHEQPPGTGTEKAHVPWNKGRLTGQKRPFTLKPLVASMYEWGLFRLKEPSARSS